MILFLQSKYLMLYIYFRNLQESCQMMFFSATYDQEVMEFAEMIVPDPIIIRLKKQEESLDNIKQYYIQCDTQEDKFTALSNIYGSISVGQAIIFCHVRSIHLISLIFIFKK